MTLTEFLLARIAEDEAAARAAGNVKIWRDDLNRSWIESPHGRIDISDVGQAVPSVDATIFDHLALHLPGRVLAECEAKRELVESLGERPVPPNDTGYLIGVWAGVHSALLHLVEPYAEHPDYDEAWRTD